MNASQKKHIEKELEIAMSNRLFEIQLFWQRSNYFLGLMIAMGVAAYSVKDTKIVPIVLIAGTLASFFWFRTNLGSKFWQESWEKEVHELSKELKIRSFEKSESDIKYQVRDSLTKSNRSKIRILIDEMVLDKPSVTYNMIILSSLSTFIWAFLLLINLTHWLISKSAIRPLCALLTL